METLAAQKQTMRRVLAERLAAVPVNSRAELELKAQRRLQSSAYFACARVIMLYAPTPGEFDISPTLLAALAAGRTVALPRVDWERSTMHPHVISAFPGGLIEGRRGIPEPAADSERLDVADIDLVITPAVGFDASGGRLGRGAGFYDRFLGDPRFVGLAVGAALEAQVVDCLPMRGAEGSGVPDRRLDAVFTEKRIILGIDRPREIDAD